MALAGVSLAGAAMSAAAALMLVARTPPRRAFAAVDWQLLVFFAGLFVLVAGIAHAGLLDRCSRRSPRRSPAATSSATSPSSRSSSSPPTLSRTSRSSLVAVAWVPHMPDQTWGYILLAVASTLAGNLTLFGSVANVIVMEAAGPRGEIGFWRFLRYGAVITAVDLVVAFSLLAVERAARPPAAGSACTDRGGRPPHLVAEIVSECRWLCVLLQLCHLAQ